MSQGAIVFVESNTTGTGRLFVQAAARQGLCPILLTADATRYDFASGGQLQVIQTDTSHLRDVLRECRAIGARERVAGVLSTSDYFAEMAARAARALRLPGPHPEALRIVKDKSVQRVRLAAAGVSVPMFRRASSPGAAVRAARTLGYSVVVKPVRGSGSIGVALCRDPHEVADHAAALLCRRTNERGQPLPRTLLVEEFLRGPEYSIETFNRSVVGITTKHLGSLPAFVEVGHDYPAVLSSRKHRALWRIALRALDALGLGWGPAHIEVRWTSHGPSVVEVNPRLAGGYIPELVRFASGIDLIAATINLAAGRPPSLDPSSRKSAAIRFLMPPCDGTFVKARGIVAASRLRGVVQASLYRRAGHAIRSTGDFRDRLGHVLAVARTASGARLAAERARRTVDICVRAS